MLNIPLHSRITGKAARAEALRKFMRYIREKERVNLGIEEEHCEELHEHFHTIQEKLLLQLDDPAKATWWIFSELS